MANRHPWPGWRYRPISELELPEAFWLVGDISRLWFLKTELDTKHDDLSGSTVSSWTYCRHQTALNNEYRRCLNPLKSIQYKTNLRVHNLDQWCRGWKVYWNPHKILFFRFKTMSSVFSIEEGLQKYGVLILIYLFFLVTTIIFSFEFFY